MGAISMKSIMQPKNSKAAILAMQLAKEFLEDGRFEADGSALAPAAISSVLPASGGATPIWYGESGFSGLSVQSVGYSAGADDEAVYVYVTRGSKRHLHELSGPRNGVQIFVSNIGKLTIRPEAASSSASHGLVFERNGRVACGSSCAPAGENYSGTIGAIVQQNGELMALSNNHVFAACNHVPVGQPIMSPSGMDSKPHLVAPRQVCRHSQIVELRSGTPSLVPLVRADAAIATIPDASIVTSWQGDSKTGYDTPANSLLPSAGLRVKKFGRTTGMTIGEVEALIPTAMPLPYKTRYFTATVWFTDIWTVRAADGEHFALPGDSGSLVVTEDGAHAVGLVFAATTKGDYGFIIPIDTVLHDLNLTLVSGHGI